MNTCRASAANTDQSDDADWNGLRSAASFPRHHEQSDGLEQTKSLGCCLENRSPPRTLPATPACCLCSLNAANPPMTPHSGVLALWNL